MTVKREIVDCTIKNAKVVTPQGIIQGGVAIQGERIACVALDGALPPAAQVIDSRGLYLLPGLIDSHVHLGLVHPFADDCRTETRSAVAGGVTTIMNYLIDHGSYSPLITQRRQIVEEEAMADVAFHVAIMNRKHLVELEQYMKAGVTSFKLFMAYRGREGERLNIQAADDGLLLAAFEALQNLGGVAMVHAENVEIFFELYERYKERPDLAAWTEARPDFCEAENIMRAAYLAHLTGVTLHIVHLSAGISVTVVKEAKIRGVNIVAETCPHYLVLTRDGANLRQPLWAKITPPVRTRDDNERLWRALAEGVIETMGTDHCALWEREKLGEDIWTTRPGLPGLETFLPLLLSEGVNKGRISLPDIVRICCYNNARSYGLYPRKGAIIPGADADLVLVDLNKEMEVAPERFHSVADFTPYTGWKLKGWPVMTMLRGQIVMREGEIFGSPGLGRFIPRRSD